MSENYRENGANLKQGAHTKPRRCQYLTHAHSHITRAVAAMENCRVNERGKFAPRRPFTADATPLNASSTQHNKFYRVFFFFAAAIKISGEQMRQLSPLMQMNIHRTIG